MAPELSALAPELDAMAVGHRQKHVGLGNLDFKGYVILDSPVAIGSGNRK